MAVLIEVARQLSLRPEKLPRQVIFLAFTGEERGLLGSANYVRHPLVPIDKTVAMINMDMVGRLTDDKLIVYGTDTATEFEGLVERLGKQLGFDIARKHGGFGPSDHSSFYAQQIPVMHFFTGSHPDYHRPTDDFPQVERRRHAAGGRPGGGSCRGPGRRSRSASFSASRKNKRPADGGDRPYFGSVPDFGSGESGYALSGVTKGSPADRGGLKAKDVIIRWAKAGSATWKILIVPCASTRPATKCRSS